MGGETPAFSQSASKGCVSSISVSWSTVACRESPALPPALSKECKVLRVRSSWRELAVPPKEQLTFPAQLSTQRISYFEGNTVSHQLLLIFLSAENQDEQQVRFEDKTRGMEAGLVTVQAGSFLECVGSRPERNATQLL